VIDALPASVLPEGARSRFVENINGLRMHVLEAGFETLGRPLIVLLHGFPELAWSWRKVIGPLAAAGYHVVAPDQRGYGRTTGWNPDYDGDLRSFGMLNLVRDVLGLVFALGHRSAAAVVGHDFGASVAAWCGVIRPDIFQRVAIMSAPFAGPPALPFDTDRPPTRTAPDGVHAAMAALRRPRKHYHQYYSTRPANTDMWRCRQGVHDFLRAYYHHKSADWTANRPFRLAGWTADELAKMPTYYIMDLHEDMAATVAHEMPSTEQITACAWLTDAELRVYSTEYERTGFQGGLQWYRVRTEEADLSQLQIFAGRTIDVPFLFVAGAADWGVYQRPGAFERMRDNACTNVLGCHLLDGAGHWVQQEKPRQVTNLLLTLLHHPA
jgi:pimeloyl-ACP methyl ester carboxylesterase